MILSVNPRITVANLALAEIRLARGNAQDASRYAKAALQEDPKLPRASVVLGNVAVGQRRYDEAIQHFQRALEANPRQASAHLGVAHAQSVICRYPGMGLLSAGKVRRIGRNRRPAFRLE